MRQTMSRVGRCIDHGAKMLPSCIFLLYEALLP